jgi:hypothetical protein
VATGAEWQERLPPAVREAALAKQLTEPVITVHHLAKSISPTLCLCTHAHRRIRTRTHAHKHLRLMGVCVGARGVVRRRLQD